MSALKLFSGLGPCSGRIAKSFSAALLLLGMFLNPFGGVALAQPTNIIEYPITAVVPAFPSRITYSAADNAFWFGMYNSSYIGRIDTISNVITYVAVNANPFGIVSVGTNLWFTETGGNSIGRIATGNSNYTDFPLTNASSQPLTMIVGPDGLLWFIEFHLSKIAAIDVSSTNLTNANGTVKFTHEYGPFGNNSLNGSPGNNAAMYGLTVGPDGNIWFTQGSLGAVGFVNTAGTLTNIFSLPNPNCEPSSITKGPDGSLWFSEFEANKVGRISMTSAGVTNATSTLITNYNTGTTAFFTEFPVAAVGSANVGVYGIILGPDGNLWFSEYYGNVIGRITPSGIVTLFPPPTVPSYPTFLATDNTNVWFGEYSSAGTTVVDDHIGEVVIAQTLSLSAANLSANNSQFIGTVATFTNSNPTDVVTVTWGDGSADLLTITNPVAGSLVKVTNSANTNNTLTVLLNNAASINVANAFTNFSYTNFSYTISGVHNFLTNTNSFPVTITVADSSNDVASASITLQTSTPGGNAVLLSASMSAAKVVLSWPGTNFSLLSATNNNGPWSNMPSATSPYTNPLSGPQRFFRLKSK